MSFYRIYYGGYELTKYCRVRRINKPIMAPVENNYLTNPNISGSSFRNSRLGQYVLEIDITIDRDVLYNLDQLNKILFQRENQPLVIGDQPERYLSCKYDGQSFGTSRYHLSEYRLTFISPDSFWRPTGGKHTTTFDAEGRAVLENLGTAESPVSFEVDFQSDCGFLGIVGAYDRFMTFGNTLEEDSITVPPSEFAMNEELDQVNTWERVTNVESLIPDYKQISSAGTAKHDQWGMQLDLSTLGDSEKWHGHAYKRNFDKGEAEIEADNFSLRSRVDISDLSGTSKRVMAMLIVVFDENDRPIMTTSIYDASQDKNELTVTFKVRDTTPGKENHSKIIYTAKLPRLNGFINMAKSGNVFDWVVHNNASTQASTTVRQLKVNDIVRLKPNANTIYDWSGKKLSLDQSIIGQQFKVFEVRSSPKGRYGLRNIRHGYVEGFFEPDAIVETSAQTTEAVQAKTIRHTMTDNGLAQLRPYKVAVWQGKWGKVIPYSQFSLNSVVVKRQYTTNSLDLVNTFMAGDKLEIDGETGQVYLNGKLFEGYNDWDSRPILIDGGKTEIGIKPSDWAEMPQVKAIYESRWL